MKSILYILLALLFIQTTCAQMAEKQEVRVINVSEQSFNDKKEIMLSRFVEKISYIPIETKPELVLGQTARYEVTNDFIIVRNVGLGQEDQILLFDRKSGIFIREIGKKGRGPEEYLRCGFLPYNEEKKEIYAFGPSEAVMVYDTQGKYTGKIKIPTWTDPQVPDKLWSTISASPDHLLDKNIFVGYVGNFTGWEKRKIVLFTKDEIVKVFPNYLTWTRTDWKSFASIGDARFYHWNNKLNFIEPFCDTLYEVTKTRMIPRYYFDYGKYHAEYSKQSDIWAQLLKRQTPNYFFTQDIDENNDFIFLRLLFNKESYTMILDKKNNDVTFCKKGNSGISGLIDDLDGLMDIVPKDFTKKDEMVFIIEPVKLLKWFNENPDKALIAGNKLPWLKNIDEFSNPIIALGKCR